MVIKTECIIRKESEKPLKKYIAYNTYSSHSLTTFLAINGKDCLSTSSHANEPSRYFSDVSSTEPSAIEDFDLQRMTGSKQNVPPCFR